jgi:hypothetical protein
MATTAAQASYRSAQPNPANLQSRQVTPELYPPTERQETAAATISASACAGVTGGKGHVDACAADIRVGPAPIRRKPNLNWCGVIPGVALRHCEERTASATRQSHNIWPRNLLRWLLPYSPKTNRWIGSDYLLN